MDGSFERLVSTRRTHKGTGGRALQLKGSHYPMSAMSYLSLLIYFTLGDTLWHYFEFRSLCCMMLLYLFAYFFLCAFKTLYYNTIPPQLIPNITKLVGYIPKRLCRWMQLPACLVEPTTGSRLLRLWNVFGTSNTAIWVSFLITAAMLHSFTSRTPVKRDFKIFHKMKWKSAADVSNCYLPISVTNKQYILKRLTMASTRVDEGPRANRFPTNAYPHRPGCFNISNGIMILAVAFILRNIFFTVCSSIVRNDIVVYSILLTCYLSLSF
jgi:hypothetical protein